MEKLNDKKNWVIEKIKWKITFNRPCLN